MRIVDIYKQKKPVISFEVFPPKKKSGLEAIWDVLGELACLSPDFISVTYGAGGIGTSNKTLDVAAHIKNVHGVEALAHLVGIGASHLEIEAVLDELEARGIENVLALRGDIPQENPGQGEYRYAAQLLRDIRSSRGEALCIGAACYPEGHIDCGDDDANLAHLKAKQEAGADFLISQLFFDNGLFFRFWESALKERIYLPISAGIMPILSKSQIQRMIFMCGASLPSNIIKLLHRYEHSPGDLRKAGIEYAVRQAQGLIEGGVDGVHIYTMNHTDIAKAHMKAMGAKARG